MRISLQSAWNIDWRGKNPGVCAARRVSRKTGGAVGPAAAGDGRGARLLSSAVHRQMESLDAVGGAIEYVVAVQRRKRRGRTAEIATVEVR